jgi:ADP-ribose pyrophosphatase YjhB (NUDIX family)
VIHDVSETQTESAWMSKEDIDTVRGRMPIVYVDAVPVRIDEGGRITHVGLLLRVMPDGTISRAIVGGRVLFGELVRDALVRHIEKDLGTMALPKLPVSPAPFTIAEYFPDPTKTGFHDPRQHAVSLAYVVPIEGICEASDASLDITWVTPAEVVAPEVRAEITSGHDRLIRMALSHAGCIV